MSWGERSPFQPGSPPNLGARRPAARLADPVLAACSARCDFTCMMATGSVTGFKCADGKCVEGGTDGSRMCDGMSNCAVRHTGLEPRSSRAPAGLLLTHASLALDRTARTSWAVASSACCPTVAAASSAPTAGSASTRPVRRRKTSARSPQDLRRTPPQTRTLTRTPAHPHTRSPRPSGPLAAPHPPPAAPPAPRAHRGVAPRRADACDGEANCIDGSDEMGCGFQCTTSADSISADGWFCPDGTCVKGKHVCDGKSDCAGGEDEMGCVLCPCSPMQPHAASAAPACSPCPQPLPAAPACSPCLQPLQPPQPMQPAAPPAPPARSPCSLYSPCALAPLQVRLRVQCHQRRRNADGKPGVEVRRRQGDVHGGRAALRRYLRLSFGQ